MYPPQWCLTHPSDPNKCLVSGFVCDVLMASSLECNSCVDCSYYFKDAAQISLSERTFESGVGDEKKVCGRGKQVATELENVALAMALVGTRELSVYTDAMLLLPADSSEQPSRRASEEYEDVVCELFRFAIDGALRAALGGERGRDRDGDRGDRGPPGVGLCETTAADVDLPLGWSLEAHKNQMESAVWALLARLPPDFVTKHRLRGVLEKVDLLHVRGLHRFVPYFLRWAAGVVRRHAAQDERTLPGWAHVDDQLPSASAPRYTPSQSFEAMAPSESTENGGDDDDDDVVQGSSALALLVSFMDALSAAVYSAFEVHPQSCLWRPRLHPSTDPLHGDLNAQCGGGRGGRSCC